MAVGADKKAGNFTFHKALATGRIQESVIGYAIASLDLVFSVP